LSPPQADSITPSMLATVRAESMFFPCFNIPISSLDS
jgi:hypothetical protein